MQNVDKELVKNRFRDSLKDYDSSAQIQKIMAIELIRKLKETASKFKKVLEIGCGTGILTREAFKDLEITELYCNDLFEESYDLIEPICKKENYSVFDGEDVENYPENIDLIISGAVFQWFNDLPLYLKNVCGKLSTNGLIAFSTFGDEQFLEIKTLTGNSLKYLKKDELTSAISAHFEVVSFFEWKEVMSFSSVKEIMSHIKATGVSGIGSKSAKKMPLTEFRKKYRERFLKDGMLPLTYDPQIWILRRKR